MSVNCLLCQLERYAYWTNLLLSSEQPVLIMGEVGVGKTSLIEVLTLSFTFFAASVSLQILVELVATVVSRRSRSER